MHCAITLDGYNKGCFLKGVIISTFKNKCLVSLDC